MPQPEPAPRPDSARAGGKVARETGRAGRARSAAGVDLVPVAVLGRVRELAEATGHELLGEAARAGAECEFQRLNNALMDAFRELGSVEAYTLLFELNLRPFSLIASRMLRLTGSRSDLQDILQEAFLAIYRYPSRFRADKPNAFRNWSYSIIRNTVYRHLQADAREGIPAEMLADVLEDRRTATPPAASERAEADQHCQRVYGLLLSLYIQAYEQELKPRDRLALELVEVQKLGYREAADVLGIRLENFKMVVCRARKKLFNALVRVLGTRLP